MFFLALALAVAPLAIALYAYIGYPIILRLAGKRIPSHVSADTRDHLPLVTITVPVYNAASTIRGTLERLLDLDYPRESLQLLVVSDASNDGTDDVVRQLSGRGIELLRMPERKGKTAAENASLEVARGEIIVNVDATVLVPRDSLKPLIRAFDDPTVGVASGRDLSVGNASAHTTGAESRYVGYEMWVRDLETRLGSIVGASGCFYGFRRCIHASPLPFDLSWDFASALVARQLGYRSVSVPEAICFVPRTAEIRTEVRRKVRTMARGLRTLFYHRSLMDPRRYGWFSFMLISHKLLRWVPYLLAPVAVISLAVLAADSIVARGLAALIVAGTLGGIISMRHQGPSSLKPIAFAGFILAAFSAGFLAWCDALRNAQMATWEPTPRPGS